VQARRMRVARDRCQPPKAGVARAIALLLCARRTIPGAFAGPYRTPS